MPRCLALAVLASAAWIGLSVGCGGADATRPRHVVMISIDTLRADHLGCYGNEVVRTPHMDHLADDGVLFENHMSSCPTTLNSHTSLMTGTYGHTHGAARNGFLVPEENTMLAELMQERGYRTAGFIGAFPLHARFQFAQGFDRYDQIMGARSGEEVNGKVLRWLDQHESEPFFLFVHYWDAHYPYTPPPPYDRMYRDDELDLKGSMDEIEGVRVALRESDPDAGQKSDVLRAAYAGGVTYADVHVGALLEALKAKGLYDDALIVLTSDHGEAMDEHSEYWDHGQTIYETSIHVPLIVKLPQNQRAGTRSERLLCNVDVMPTILDCTGIPTPPAVEGVSFAAVLEGRSLESPTAMFAEATKPHTEAHEAGSWVNQLKCQAIRAGRWKLTHRPMSGQTELFDLEADQGEETDLMNDPSPENSRRAKVLLAALLAWSAQEGTGEEDMSEESLQALRELGYAGGK